jgi:hypothetical protein
MNAAQWLTVFAYLAATVAVWIVLTDYGRNE